MRLASGPRSSDRPFEQTNVNAQAELPTVHRGGRRSRFRRRTGAHRSVAEKGIANRDFAAVDPRQSRTGKLQLARSFYAGNARASSARTRQLLRWRPTHGTLLEDIGAGHYPGREPDRTIASDEVASCSLPAAPKLAIARHPLGGIVQTRAAGLIRPERFLGRRTACEGRTARLDGWRRRRDPECAGRRRGGMVPRQHWRRHACACNADRDPGECGSQSGRKDAVAEFVWGGGAVHARQSGRRLYPRRFRRAPGAFHLLCRRPTTPDAPRHATHPSARTTKRHGPRAPP